MPPNRASVWIAACGVLAALMPAVPQIIEAIAKLIP
jgi:hypothetical protein